MLTKRDSKLLFKALEVIGDAALDFAALTMAIISSPYGASYKRLDYEQSQIRDGLDRIFKSEAPETSQKRKYSDLIYRLKRDGLVKEIADKKKKNNKIYKLTQKGKEMLMAFKKGEILPGTNYEKQEGDKFIIVIFDIPEKERRKRQWLRSVLVNMGFNMEQKSVWTGKVRIKKDLIEDLFKLNLENYVKIFEITKKGNLEHLF